MKKFLGHFDFFAVKGWWRLKKLGLLINIGFLLASCAGGGPDLVLAQTEVDLGPVVNGEVRTIEIPLQNLGEKDLIIEAVSTSCGCTQATITPATIAPGESAVLEVQFDSGAHGPEENGPVMRQVFIASNDANEPEIEFRITADILRQDS